MSHSREPLQGLPVDYFDAAALQLEPAVGFEVLQLATDNFTRTAEFGGQLLVRGFQHMFITGQLQQVAGEADIEPAEGDFLDQ